MEPSHAANEVNSRSRRTRWPVQSALPARTRFVGQQRIGLQQALDELVERWKHEDDAQDNQERELKAGLE